MVTKDESKATGTGRGRSFVRGLLAPITLALRRKLGGAYGAYFDQFYKVDTAGVVAARRLRVVGTYTPRHVDFMSVPPKTLGRALKLVPELVDTLTFVEMGCGKGRAVLLASTSPFRRVIGVEHAPELAAIAEKNVKTFAGNRLCGEVRIVRADPTRFHLPPDRCVLFFFGPFEDPASFESALANARMSLAKKPRPFSVVWVSESGFEAADEALAKYGFRRVGGPKVSRFDPGIIGAPLRYAAYSAK